VRGRAQRGFTLLEVLGAVLVLGLLYSVLAEAAIQGLRAEGESRRRLEASLFADELLSEIEASLDSGGALPVGVSLEEDEPYVIELTVSPVDAGALLPPGALGEDETLASLMGAEADESPILEIVLKISWSEGDRELSVTRTTLGLGETGLGTPQGSAAVQGGAGRVVPLDGAQQSQRPWLMDGNLDELLERRQKAHEWR
jgi:prepilin-type N-terminal cleavage/methylation domain-containing protein